MEDRLIKQEIDDPTDLDMTQMPFSVSSCGKSNDSDKLFRESPAVSTALSISVLEPNGSAQHSEREVIGMQGTWRGFPS